MKRPVLLLLLTLLSVVPATAVAAPPPRGPLVPKDPAAKPCAHPGKTVSGSVTLKQSCIYDDGFVIKTSNTTLDCNGAQIVPASGPAVSVRGQIDGVTVKNCYTEGAGVDVRPPAQKTGESDDDLRKRSPTNVVFANLHVSGAKNVGIYVHHHVVGATVKDSITEKNWSAGVYLGRDTQKIVVRNNLIRDNGFKSSDGSPRIGWARREGIAVDASAQNVIEDNTLEGNAFGGIFLYKNCWEHHSTKPNSTPRLQHSHSNIIRGNTFRKMDFGVWIASRQARDLGNWDCGDKTPYNNPILIFTVIHPAYPKFKSTIPAPYLPLVSIWLDHAEENTIEDNDFTDISLAGVRIEDDGTQVTGNLFIGDFEYIYLGTPFRSSLLKQPVADTVIKDNSFASPKAQLFDKQLALVPNEHTGTQLANNLRACKTPWGAWLRSGASVKAFQPIPGGCTEEQRTCSDGSLSGSAPLETCVPGPQVDAGADVGADVGADADADAGPATDSAPAADSAAPPDSAGPDGPQAPGASSGCSLARGAPPLPLLWLVLLFGLALLLRRR